MQPYKTVSIVGLGLMGGSLALALRRTGLGIRLLGVSRPETLAKAQSLAAIDDAFPYSELVEAARISDLVVLASPISSIIEHLRTLGRASPRLPRGLVITDVGSTKRLIVKAAEEVLPSHVSFVGGHPLAGSEARGVHAADPFLFQNAYYVLTPAQGSAHEVSEALAGLLSLTGARIILLSAEDHDRIAATISHLPQLLAVSLVRFLDDLGPNRDHGVHLAAGGFRDMTRIASSPYSVWRDIVETNRDIISEVLARFLQDTRASLEGLSPTSLETLFERSKKTRAEIPRDSKGFLRRLHDVLVVVEDRPGTLAEITVPLATSGINIKDIEILKVREGEAGTLRLAFESGESALRAIDLLAQHGYKARMRE
jgi:prephenate dehydrogenase